MATLPPYPTTDTDVAIGDAIHILDHILQSPVALAVWRRAAPAGIAMLDLDSVDDLSFTLDPNDDAIAPLLDAGYPTDTARALRDDIAMLALAHRRLTGARTIAVRLDVIETDACHRFHADYVTLRMLSTYRGAATQWCRTATPDTIGQLGTGDVGVFKGRIAMEEPTILHRSPPVRAAGEQRLLLVLDPA